jgi:hypothetical protein
MRARDLLAVNPAAPFGAQLLKLCVERLSVGAHTGIAETPVFAGWFGLGFQFRSGRDLVITPESKTWLVRWRFARRLREKEELSGLWTQRQNRFATDSPLERDGFEPSVPG